MRRRAPSSTGRETLKLVVHGDDFTVSGLEGDLDWFRAKIQERFEVKFRGRLGPGAEDDKSIRILNRVVEWSKEGIHYEVDQRHAELIVSQLGLSGSAKALSAPGKKEDSNEEDEELTHEEATKYRALTARANYLSQDRSDIQFAVKELCRRASDPRSGDWGALKRLGRYLSNKTRSVTTFPYQKRYEAIKVSVDTDYAGCKRTRRSTSGGIAQLGDHLIKTWSITQAVIALSSGEAEYYGIVKGASIAM